MLLLPAALKAPLMPLLRHLALTFASQPPDMKRFTVNSAGGEHFTVLLCGVGSSALCGVGSSAQIWRAFHFFDDGVTRECRLLHRSSHGKFGVRFPGALNHVAAQRLILFAQKFPKVFGAGAVRHRDTRGRPLPGSGTQSMR